MVRSEIDVGKYIWWIGENERTETTWSCAGRIIQVDDVIFTVITFDNFEEHPLPLVKIGGNAPAYTEMRVIAWEEAEDYIKGKITISKAAHMADITIWEMQKYLVEQGYKSDYSVEDLDKELKLMKS